ncbi:hypothetical protein VSR68_03300 [Paraburkholderia phymatum]|uniref:hypothetical protein n=1 Tax=Paraburkholderia phymatum TaxID=148447 RepID=UPI00317C154F
MNTSYEMESAVQLPENDESNNGAMMAAAVQTANVIARMIGGADQVPANWLQSGTPYEAPKRKCAPPPEFKNLPVIDTKTHAGLKAMRKLHLELCGGNHDAAELYGEILNPFTVMKDGKPLVENIRDDAEGNRAYWWGQPQKKWAARKGWNVDHMKYIFKVLRARNLIATRKAKTPYDMLQCRPLVADGAAHIPGIPDASNYAELLKDKKSESLMQQGSQTENCPVAMGQKLPRGYRVKIAPLNNTLLKACKRPEVKSVKPVSSETEEPAPPLADAGATPDPEPLPPHPKGVSPLPTVGASPPVAARPPSRSLAVVRIWEACTGRSTTPKERGQLRKLMLDFRRPDTDYLDPLPFVRWIALDSSWYRFVRPLYEGEIPHDYRTPHVGLLLKKLNEAVELWLRSTLTPAERAARGQRVKEIMGQLYPDEATIVAMIKNGNADAA